MSSRCSVTDFQETRCRVHTHTYWVSVRYCRENSWNSVQGPNSGIGKCVDVSKVETSNFERSCFLCCSLDLFVVTRIQAMHRVRNCVFWDALRFGAYPFKLSRLTSMNFAFLVVYRGEALHNSNSETWLHNFNHHLNCFKYPPSTSPNLLPPLLFLSCQPYNLQKSR